uniref:Ninja-family protein n=1 Tax=Davidia involucrata TaxID=16924 RepID=A0A5B6ZCT6_DAVIN
MAEAEEKGETNHVSLQMNIFSRDLLQRFISGDHFPRNFEERKHEEEEEDVELSLGLSLNGRFGVDPKTANKLIRSSSISNFMMMTEDYNTACVVRTCSLPAETEEWRKRKELQSLRRMEAKRKRLEKLKNVRMLPGEVNLEENQGSVWPFAMANWVSGATGGAVSVTVQGIESKGERGNCLEGQPQPQGSIGSQGSISSGISEFESQPIQGMNKYNEARSPASVQSLPEHNEQKPVSTPGKTEKSGKFAGAAVENSSMKGTLTGKGANEMARNMMLDMPCVSTRGDGPNGKRIEGFLYRYRKGEEVRIVCVCHGSFLSPAEFVKHAGGGDVAYPLKHIVVNPSSLL